MRSGILFLAAVAVAGAGEVGAQEAPATPDIGPSLIGTAADGTGGGLAIIRWPDDTVRFVGLGNDVDGYAITRIDPARILLRNADGEIALHLPGPDPTGGPAAQLLAIRRSFLNEIDQAVERQGGAGVTLVQQGDRVMVRGPTGNASLLRVPTELVDEAFAPAGEIPLLQLEAAARRDEELRPLLSDR